MTRDIGREKRLDRIVRGLLTAWLGSWLGSSVEAAHILDCEPCQHQFRADVLKRWRTGRV